MYIFLSTMRYAITQNAQIKQNAQSKYLVNFKVHIILLSFCYCYLLGTVRQSEKALINDRLRVSKVFSKFRIPIIYNFSVIYQ